MFNFCKKKTKEVFYSFENLTSLKDKDLSKEESEEILKRLFVEPAMGRSDCWFSKLKTPRKDNSFSSESSVHEIAMAGSKHMALESEGKFTPVAPHIRNASDPDRYKPTAKICPGIKNFLRNSFLIKFPCDVMVTIKSDGYFVASTKNSGDGTLSLSEHRQFQFLVDDEKSNLFKDKICIKFNLPISLTTGVPYRYLDPMYHTKQPYDVTLGIINDEQMEVQPLNIITFFDIPKDGVVEHKFKLGDIMAYMEFNEKVTLKYKEKLDHKMVFSKHIRNRSRWS